MTVTIRPCDEQGQAAWMALRAALWPEIGEIENRTETDRLLHRPSAYVAFLAWDEAGQALGFAEASLRHDYVNGCSTSPVAFLEGLFVVEGARRQGVARALVDAVEGWAVALGCTELASDALIDNAPSHGMHAALGFGETERVVCFRKDIDRAPGH